MSSPETKLSPRERQMMDVVYRLGKATARQIQDELSEDLANATVRTVLRILETKGHLKHREAGRQFVYSPVRSRRNEAASALKRVVSVFYEGSMSNAFSGMIGARDSQLSDEELDELAAIVEKARARARAK